MGTQGRENRMSKRNRADRTSDRRGDMPLPKAPPQVRAPNQNGHPRPKDLIADQDAEWEYKGGPGKLPPSKRRQRVNPKPRLIGAQTRPQENVPYFYMPHSRSFGKPKDGWVYVQISGPKVDAEIERKLNGGYDPKNVCPVCNMARAVKNGYCTENCTGWEAWKDARIAEMQRYYD
jgi:hypothetical protein